MSTNANNATPEALHQWDVIEAKRIERKITKKDLSAAAGMQDSYYYQSHKFRRPIPLNVLSIWSNELGIPVASLFLENENNPKARIIHLIQQADEEKLPQALRVLEAILVP